MIEPVTGSATDSALNARSYNVLVEALVSDHITLTCSDG